MKRKILGAFAVSCLALVGGIIAVVFQGEFPAPEAVPGRGGLSARQLSAAERRLSTPERGFRGGTEGRTSLEAKKPPPSGSVHAQRAVDVYIGTRTSERIWPLSMPADLPTARDCSNSLVLNPRQVSLSHEGMARLKLLLDECNEAVNDKINSAGILVNNWVRTKIAAGEGEPVPETGVSPADDCLVSVSTDRDGNELIVRTFASENGSIDAAYDEIWREMIKCEDRIIAFFESTEEIRR